MRFPDYKDDWCKEKLGRLMDFKVTNSFSRNDLNYDNGAVKNIHYGDIHTKFQTLLDITREEVPYVNKNISLDRISDDYYCKEGDLVFADASEDLIDVGKSIEILNLNNEKLLSGLHTLLARPKQGLFFKGFNGYLFKSKNVRLQIQKEAQGTKVLSISARRISNIKLSFPSEKEQEKITSFLSRLDQRIQTQSKIIENFESLMIGLRQKIFLQKIRFKSNNGNKFPEWTKIQLGKLITKTGNKNKKNIQYPIYSINNKEGFLPQNEQFEGMNSNDRGYDISLYKLIKKNTFAYNPARINVGSIGYSRDLEDVIVSSLYVCFKTKEELQDEYLYQYLETFPFKKDVLRYSEGGVRQYLFFENFSKIKIPLPCIDEQIRIANFLSSIDEKIEKEKYILEQYQQQKKYLLQNLFI
ncbi:restriction endonuclease subunit S [Sinomicrobium pectinilyticum]|uniref:Restriction endonuclease subunit S n=1 Tax=Sinomicrobium pectinilyticum TaxID=1084421 RepID=A0A3N0F5C4_SINP1|nr:restriction endonuclease subunit S [Sinomicrobium pectinilyticum]RNL95182.1 restriction endonuclease subunit S [Sinomicrobium pectinilyticum]